jgi:hypothetical protein
MHRCHFQRKIAWESSQDSVVQDPRQKDLVEEVPEKRREVHPGLGAASRQGLAFHVLYPSFSFNPQKNFLALAYSSYLAT